MSKCLVFVAACLSLLSSFAEDKFWLPRDNNIRQVAVAGKTNSIESLHLCYDAEVSYLEGTGTQYIKTGFLPNNEAGMYGHVTAIPEGGSSAGGQMFAGVQDVRGDSYSFFGFVTNAEGKEVYRWGLAQGASTRVSDNEGNVSEFSLNYLNSRKATYNNSSFTYGFSTVLSQFSHELHLFGSNLYGEAKRFAKIRIHDIKLSIGADVKMDLIAVRVGNTGYMYDKISGRMFKNSGTGNFVLGPDIKVIDRNVKMASSNKN